MPANLRFDMPLLFSTCAWNLLLLIGLPVAVALVLLRDQPLPYSEWYPAAAAAIPFAMLLLALLSRFWVSRVEFNPDRGTVEAATVVFGLRLGRIRCRFDQIESIDAQTLRSGEQQVSLSLCDGQTWLFSPGDRAEETVEALQKLIRQRD